MITNALKYAFPDDRKGNIGISLKKDPDDNIRVIFKDDGIGLFRGNNNNGLGLQLVDTLVNDQLGGAMELTVDQGTQFDISFNEANH